MAKGDWTRASIQCDRDRFEEAHRGPSDDGLPAGMTPEEAGRRGLMSGPLAWDSDCDREPAASGWL